MQNKKKLPVGGVVVLVLAGLAIAFFFSGGGSGCSGSGAGAITEPMELEGRWLGVRLAAVDSPTARQLGVPPMTSGVVVAEVPQEPGSRGFQAALLAGDVIVSVDGTSVANLAELYTQTTRLNVGRELPISILRQGTPLSLVAPAPPMMMQPLPAGMAPGPSAAAPGTPSAPLTAEGGMQFYCPSEQLSWSQAQVGADFRCPRCRGALTRVQ